MNGGARLSVEAIPIGTIISRPAPTASRGGTSPILGPRLRARALWGWSAETGAAGPVRSEPFRDPVRSFRSVIPAPSRKTGLAMSTLRRRRKSACPGAVHMLCLGTCLRGQTAHRHVRSSGMGAFAVRVSCEVGGVIIIGIRTWKRERTRSMQTGHVFAWQLLPEASGQGSPAV